MNTPDAFTLALTWAQTPPRGSRKQRRATATRRAKFLRKHREEINQVKTGILSTGAGGGVFGITILGKPGW